MNVFTSHAFCLPVDDCTLNEGHIVMLLLTVNDCYYLCRHSASGEHIVTLGVMLSHRACMCVCPPSCLCDVSTAHCISLGGKGNMLYPVLSGFRSVFMFMLLTHFLCGLGTDNGKAIAVIGYAAVVATVTETSQLGD